MPTSGPLTRCSEPPAAKEIGTFTESGAWQDGSIQNNFRVSPGSGILSLTNPGTITVKDSLGGSATVAVTLNLKYS
jgi:hypothetical protein